MIGNIFSAGLRIPAAPVRQAALMMPLSFAVLLSGCDEQKHPAVPQSMASSSAASSNRPGGLGGNDVYISTRQRLIGKSN